MICKWSNMQMYMDNILMYKMQMNVKHINVQHM